MARTMICRNHAGRVGAPSSLLSTGSKLASTKLRWPVGASNGGLPVAISKSRAPTPNTSVRQETLSARPWACSGEAKDGVQGSGSRRRRPWAAAELGLV